MKKLFFISLAVIFVLGIALVGCGPTTPTAPTAIKVGLVRDLTGVLAFYDEMSGGPVYRAFAKYINDQGGIQMSTYGKKLPIELDVRPYDPTSPGELGTQTTALITTDKVNFVWGGPGTTTVYTQASICNAYGIVLMTLEGGATDMTRDPAKLPSWPYVWINLTYSDWYQIPVLYQMLKSEGVTTPKAYVVYIDNEHGHEYLEVTQEIFGAGNVTAVGHNQYTATASDMDTLVQGAVAALGNATSPNYDIFCAFTYMPYLAYLMSSFQKYNFNPPAIIMGPGSTGGSFVGTFNATMVEGITGFGVANNKSSVAPETTTMSFAHMYDLIMPQVTGPFTPADCWDVWGDPCFWSGLEMWAQAVKTVGNLDVGYSAKVRSVLASFNATNPATTVMGNCWYHVFGNGLGGGVIDYLAEPGQLCQWQNGYTEIVGFTGINSTNWAVPPVCLGGGAPTPLPKYDVTAPFIYPMTNKWGWLS